MFRRTFSLLVVLLLFVACNQGRHITSDRFSKADQEYTESRNKKLNKLNNYAHTLIGKSYKLGASGPKSFDCSGFTSFVYNSINISLPRTATDQSRMGHEINIKKVQPGDLLFFGKKTINHVAIVTSVKGISISMIHSSSSEGVIEQSLSKSDYWMKRLKFARRVTL
jgi:probable lipoprotein NlpC